jgi:hypothetical protein
MRNARGTYLMGATGVPMKRRHSTWLEQHGSEERTLEDTMNHCERSPSPVCPEIWAERAICREVRPPGAILINN